MANRLDDIRGLAEYHATEVTESPRDWMNYLDTAARLYRYPFSDQLLIHAQRPNATACASLETWNEKMMRWVNRGAKGIALIDDTRPKVRLRYVFDVLDTHMVRGGKTPYLWELPERHEDAVKEHLADIYDLPETVTLSETLLALAKQLTEENLEDMMEGLSYVTEDTFLEGMDEDYLRVSFRTQVENSTYYMLARRCGLDPMDMLEEDDFRGIIDYNRLSVLSYVGNTISQLTEPVLIDIGRTVTKYLHQEQAKEIDNRSNNHYNALKRESENSDNKIEGGLPNGDDVLSQGRLSVPESDNRERGDMDRQVRNASPDISEGESEESVSEPSSDRETAQAPAGDRGDRPGENGADHGGTAEDLSGSVQGDEPDGMGSAHEQPESDGGRDHLDGIGVQLIPETSENDLSEAEEEIASALSLPELPSVEEQIRAIEAPMEAAFAADSQIPTEVVDEILRMGGNRDRSPLRLIYNYMIEQTPEEYADFVKREYGHGGQGVMIDRQEYAVWFNEFEMKIAKGDTAHDNQSDRVTLSWEDVSDRIHQLLRQGEYAPQVVLDTAYDNILSEYARALIYMERDMAEGVSELVFEDTEIFRGSFPEVEDRVAELLTHAEFREDIRDRLEALAEIYQEDHSVMRFSFYHPERMAELFEKLTREAVPFRSVPGFSWNEQEVFITEDEINAFLASGGPVSEGRLATYSFFLQHEDGKERADFLKRQYGEGGRSHALSGADHTDANYSAKGIRLTKRTYSENEIELKLNWSQAAKRVDALISEGQFLSAADFEHMPEYEQMQMASRVIRFYHRMPEDVERPYTSVDWSEQRKEIATLFADEQKAGALGQKMQEDFVSLPEDFSGIEEKEQLLIEVSAYLDGTYTIFPMKEAPLDTPTLDSRDIMGEKRYIEGEQLSLTDFMELDAPEGEDTTPTYSRSVGSYVYLDQNHLYQIDRETQFDVYLKDLENPHIAGRVVPQRDFDRMLDQNPLNRGLKDGENPFLKNTISVYKECLYTVLPVFRERPEYEVIQSESLDSHVVEDIIKSTVSEIMEQNKENAPTMYQAYQEWTSFEAYLVEDIYHQTNPDLSVDHRDAVALHSAESIAPDWVRGMEITVETPWETIQNITEQELSPLVYEAAEEYNSLKEQYPDAMVGFEQDGNFEFYGEDARTVARILETKVLDKETEFGVIAVTGFPKERWAAYAKRIWSQGQDVYLAGEQEDGTHAETKYLKKEDYLPIGAKLSFENRQFQVDQVDFRNQTASLMDITFQGQTGFPIFRSMPLREAREIYEEMDETPSLAELILPDVPEEQNPENIPQELTNFHITDMDLGAGGKKAKFRANLDAIQVLQKIEFEDRLATPEEQEVLSKYVGWGGIPEAFEEGRSGWEKEYAELRQTLTPEEFTAARASTLNAFYTSPTVIQAMYAALEKMGLKEGNLLEPSCGVGNFMGMLPESMEDMRMYGVELDSVSGRIAKQLYQKNSIAIRGFEETQFPDSFFDGVIGNVPFGNYGVVDKKYDRNHFMIHDYFIAKSLDLVRPGGVVAVVTSSGTMDKQNPSVRQYFAQRADLLGAIRLPNNAFSRNANTDVVADILFFQKRDRAALTEPEWVKLSETPEGYSINQYFVNHPEMVLGELTTESTQYGKQEVTVKAVEGADLAEQLKEAITHIEGKITEAEITDSDLEEDVVSIPAEPSVKNFSFTVVDGSVYYRENSVMNRVEVPATTQERIMGMVSIRDRVNELIGLQMEESSETEITECQKKLNEQYDKFTAKYGLISSSANKRAFNQDSSYCLLTSLEMLDEEGNLKRKADIFTKRTIRRAEPVTSVDTASEALAVSIAEKAKVDLPFMAELSGKTEEEITEELTGVIFKDPLTGIWETSDAYLSGNVREKLTLAQGFAEGHPEYAVNVEFLQKVQPKDLDASEIEVRLGATWIKPEYITEFMGELFKTPRYYLGDEIAVKYAPVTGQWQITGKNMDNYRNPLVTATYGTQRANAYRLLEDALNLRDTKLYDTIQDVDGTERRVLNRQETMLAQQKQEMIKEAFKDWAFRDMERREDLCKTYNILFNSVRPREYDGSHINFVGMTPEIQLMAHQKNAVAHMLYGDNTLLAHCVGAGKTFQMIAAGMESKRLGLAQKCLYVVPNHLTEQWGSDFLRLYPGANILVSTKKDFEPANRKKFCSRIATGDYDAIIIGHSQFEKIPLSMERQIGLLEQEIEDITLSIEEAKEERGERFTIKQMEKTRKTLETKLKRLNDQTRKDDVVTFEQLGVDRLFVDESHNFKNLFLYTKMRNVAGIAQTDAQKSSDMFMKCRYMDELTGGKGITFATGTPVSNSMVELYTNMRYLQYDTLQKMNLGLFDSWAATFGETVTAIELAPEGTGYRAKTRFAKFYNLPELISVFKEAADIQTADMLKLPVPEAEFVNVVLKPSETQQDLVASFADRAEAVRGGRVPASQDNMLTITNDGRKCALDQRLIDDMLPDEPVSKVNSCAENVFSIWEETKEQKSTQLVFCDLSTPKADGSFNVYDDLREKLVAKGIPKEEIVFIHEAETEAKKAELFSKVRSGQVRVLIGSTPKLGAGTNIQDKLIALHHLDAPWKPSDLEQQEGRILRQGNQNKKVKIFRYVTEGTFDSYMWQILENKQKFISQIMTSKSPVRACEDVDDTALSYAEIKALATGNPYIKEKMDLDIQVSKLKLMKANHTSQIYRLETDIARTYPVQIAAAKTRIEGLKQDIKMAAPLVNADKDHFSITIGGNTITDKKEAGTALIAACAGLKAVNTSGTIGEYQGFQLSASYNAFYQHYELTIKGKCSYTMEVGKDALGNIQRLNNVLGGLDKRLQDAEQNLDTLEKQLETAREEVTKPFPQEAELSAKQERLTELNALLNMDKGGQDAILDESDQEVADAPKRSSNLRAADDRDADAPRKHSVLERLKPKEREKQAAMSMGSMRKRSEPSL